jgi:hypothetical protein
MITVDNDAATASAREMKGIICGDRYDDGEHNNQPCDDDGAVTSMTMTKTKTTTLTMTAITTTTMAVTTAAVAVATTTRV